MKKNHAAIERAIITTAVLVVLIVGTLYAYTAAHNAATAARGYEAIGGEAVILMWPLFLYIGVVLVRDFRDFQAEATAIDADYTQIPGAAPYTVEDLERAANMATKAFATVTISAEEVTVSFERLGRLMRQERET